MTGSEGSQSKPEYGGNTLVETGVDNNQASNSDAPWPIPRSLLSIVDIIQKFKYSVGEHTEYREGFFADSYAVMDSNRDFKVGTVTVVKEDDCTIRYEACVMYNPKEPNQIQKAVSFRKLLEQLEQPYSEVPPKSEIFRDLKEQKEVLDGLLFDFAEPKSVDPSSQPEN